MWLLIDDQVEQLADPNFPRRTSTRVPGAHELVAHENYVVYFDQDESLELPRVGKVCAQGVRGGNGARQFQRRYALETVGLLMPD